MDPIDSIDPKCFDKLAPCYIPKVLKSFKTGTGK